MPADSSAGPASHCGPNSVLRRCLHLSLPGRGAVGDGAASEGPWSSTIRLSVRTVAPTAERSARPGVLWVHWGRWARWDRAEGDVKLLVG
jgi:hypothetical protein